MLLDLRRTHFPLCLMLLALSLAGGCRHEPEAGGVTLRTSEEVSRDGLRHPAPLPNRVLYAQPEGWGENQIAISFDAPSYLKSLPPVAAGPEAPRQPADLDPWRWERIDKTHFRFFKRPDDRMTVDITGRLWTEGNRIFIAGEIVNLLDVMIWEEDVAMKFNFDNAKEFADPDREHTFLFPEREAAPFSVRRLVEVENMTAFQDKASYLFWVSHPNAPRHLNRMRRTNATGNRSVTVEGDPLLFVCGDSKSGNLIGVFGVYAKPGQTSHFSMTITFEEQTGK